MNRIKIQRPKKRVAFVDGKHLKAFVYNRVEAGAVEGETACYRSQEE